jgi:hypothetical protein
VSTIRFKFKVNLGREGLPLDVLARHAEDTLAFLKSLANDLNLPPEQSLWVAKEFKNGSLIYTAENHLSVDDVVVEKAASAAIALITCKGDRAKVPSFVSDATIRNFSEIKAPFGHDDVVRIGVVGVDDKTKWKSVSYMAFQAIADMVEGRVVYLGSVMGTTYEWNKGAEKPYLKLRDVATGELVKCTYNRKDYAKVRALFDRESDMVIVYGTITYDRLADSTELTHATDFESVAPLSEEEQTTFYGSLPGLTGDLSAAEYVREQRGGNE